MENNRVRFSSKIVMSEINKLSILEQKEGKRCKSLYSFGYVQLLLSSFCLGSHSGLPIKLTRKDGKIMTTELTVNNWAGNGRNLKNAYRYAPALKP